MEKKSARTWRWIVKNGKKSFPIIVLLSLISMALSLIQVRFATASKDVMDIATKQAEGVLSTAFFTLVALLVIRLILQITVNYLNVHACSRFEISLKRHIFSILLRKDYLSVSKFHSGELMNRIDSDVAVIVNGIIDILPYAVMFLTSIIGAFFVLYRIDGTLALIILCVGPLVGIGARIYSAKYKKMHKLCQEYDGKTKSFMLEILQNLLVVKSFGCEEKMLDKSEMLQTKSYKLRIKRVTVSVFAQIGMFLIFNAGYYFAMAYAAYKLSLGELTYGDVTAILALVSQIQSPFKSISSLIPRAFAVAASVERLLELEDVADEPLGEKVLPPDVYDKMGSIVFDNVTFSYSNDAVVSGININVKKGECAVIAGESGAGKSTAIKLLLGIMSAQKGRIYIEYDGQQLPVGRDTRSLFAYVPQGNLILSGTIRENIAFARDDATDEQIINAAKVAQIWDFIKTLDKGLDTKLGEKGLGLSEGQVQRISIARAILHDAPILLLDESTSALDSQTEKNLLSAIREMTDKTCIIVSHKQAAFDICDKVVYIEKKNNKN
ncbi:MAG: ABC transporter ATP-binding protein/permease [Firmicutes bacterium]|nr:ABC transporter ATP-binding protein/permease [Bacillota bacterium]